MSSVRGASLAWEALFRAQVTVMRRLEHDGLSPDLTLKEYDVLFSLSSWDGKPMRLKDLNERVLMHQSSLSRMVERLVERGLVQTSRGNGDKRELGITLTPQGQAIQREMGRKHAAQIAHYVGSALTETELAELAHISNKLRDAQSTLPPLSVTNTRDNS